MRDADSAVAHYTEQELARRNVRVIAGVDRSFRVLGLSVRITRLAWSKGHRSVDY